MTNIVHHLIAITYPHRVVFEYYGRLARLQSGFQSYIERGFFAKMKEWMQDDKVVQQCCDFASTTFPLNRKTYEIIKI